MLQSRVRPSAPATQRRGLAVLASVILLAATLPRAFGAPDAGAVEAGPGFAEGDGLPDHLVISELSTGGGSASDEFVEIYNPAATPLPLEGLELVYVTASGATVTRKAAWDVDAAEVAPGAHVLIANEAGIYAAIADATYANGLAATGGSLALRIVGASAAVDSVGWGTATNTSVEGSPAVAAAAGASLERLPGGELGSGQDTDDNASDFVERNVPDPQNSASPPIVVGGPPVTPTPIPTTSGTPGPISASPSPTLSHSATPSLSPAPTATPPEPVLTIAAARALADGAPVTVEASALTGHDFADGGGFVADATGGIAVLVTGGTYARGDRLRVSGTVDDRFAQRTIRADGAGVVRIGAGTLPQPANVSTAAVGEAVEGRLVQLSARLLGSPTSLTAGLAFDVDDGTGPTRVLVGTTTGIETAGWVADAVVKLVGVVGQRDSTGTATAGYRVMPRDAGDVLSVTGPGEPSQSPGASQPASATPLPPSGSVVAIAQARTVATNATVRIRGIVTMPSDLVEPGSAALQDESGAIALRLGDEAGSLAQGELVEVEGKRSTFAGMLTVRVTTPPLRVGTSGAPAPAQRTTGRIGEAEEAHLLVVRGGVGSSINRSSAGNTYFDLDDGSGPLRVYLSPRSGIAPSTLTAGTWVEIQGVLFQETSGQQPERGYRLWPRSAADIRLMAAPVAAGSNGAAGAGPATGVGPGRSQAVVARPNPPAGGRHPRLAVARPTASPPVALVQPVADVTATADRRPLLAAGLLLAAALAFAGGGGLLLGRAGLARLRDAAMGQLRRAEPNTPAEEDAAVGPAAPPAMVPLVVESAPAARPPQLSVVDGGARTREHGRILPPT